MIPTTDLCDANELAIESGSLRVLPSRFAAYGKNPRFMGQAFTLKVFEDNTLVRSTLETDGQGQVLVVDGGGSERCAMVGGNLGMLAEKNNWAGIVVYGYVRDSLELNGCAVGIRALGTHPQKSQKRNSGFSQINVAVFHVPVRPGDWVYADEDGVLVSSEAIHT